MKTEMGIFWGMTAPTLLYGSETWIPTLKNLNKIQSTENKFLKSFEY